MGVTDFFAGEIATELLKQLFLICRKSSLCRPIAEQFIADINDLSPIIEEIKHTGVELPQHRQRQLDDLTKKLGDALDLAGKVLRSSRFNMYKNLQHARKLEKLQKAISRFLKGPIQAHVLADVHHVRFDTAERFDRLERLLGGMKIGVDQTGCLGEALKKVEEEQKWCEGNLVNLGVGMELAKRKVKGLVMEREDLGVIEICGIGGSGKTTLAREICRDDQVRSYFGDRVFFLTVSQSPNLEQLRSKIWGMISGCNIGSSGDVLPQWNLQYEGRMTIRRLLVLDDVWSFSELEQLIFRIPGLKIIVVSRFKFASSFVNYTYELELLGEDEAMSLFCHFAFGQGSVPLGLNKTLVKQVVDECQGLPLALKVIGSSLKGQPEMVWASARSRLSRSQPIDEFHEDHLLKRMKLSIDYLPSKVKECFLDLGAFPEDKKIPLDVLINMWVELHDIDEDEAFAILVDLSNKNLLTLVKDSRAGDLYSSYYDISVFQHDVLRDLAIHISSIEDINSRSRLVMPRRETQPPKEWERNADQPFIAQIVSLHTDEMKEMDWFAMEFPKAEVLILNFSSGEYFLPPFIHNMPKLRALILINYSSSNAVLHNLDVFSDLTALRSLWLEKICVPLLPETTLPLKSLQKISLILCNINKSLDESFVDLPRLFPHLSEFTMDHCINLNELPSSICLMRSLKSLSVTNCDSLGELPSDLAQLDCLQFLRIYACPKLRKLPPGIGHLCRLKYLDISQCVNLTCLPEGIGGCTSLEKIDMRECPQVRTLPESVTMLWSLRRVICDESHSSMWRDVESIVPGLFVQIAEECFNLDWLSE